MVFVSLARAVAQVARGRSLYRMDVAAGRAIRLAKSVLVVPEIAAARTSSSRFWRFQQKAQLAVRVVYRRQNIVGSEGYPVRSYAAQIVVLRADALIKEIRRRRAEYFDHGVVDRKGQFFR